jgi:LemA protein
MIDFITNIFWIVVYVAIAVAIVAAWGYNKLRQQSENVKTAWSNISVATRKKVALVNQLIDVVRGYQESEKLVMLKISEDTSAAALQQTYQQSGTMVSQVSAMVQRFPELKASAQYSRLIDSIQSSEIDVQNARTRYNAAVNQYNVQRSSIPHVFYSGLLGFQKAEYLSLDAAESSDAGVQKPFVSDDGERLNALLGAAGAKTMAAATGLVRGGMAIAEKCVARLGAPVAPLPPPLPGPPEIPAEFHYLDTESKPAGPASSAQLKSLFESGAISAETPVLKVGSKDWVKYRDLGA